MLFKLHYCGAVAEIDTIGGEMISYQTPKGTSCLWNGNPEIWPGHAPHLFPIIGTLAHGAHQCEQHNFSMTKHGFLRNTEFTLVAKNENSLTLLRSENKESLSQYPFLFDFFVTHTLSDHGFSTNYKIVNRGACTMPFCIGGHPSFACPIFAEEKFTDYDLILHAVNSNIALLARDDTPLLETSCVPLPIQNSVLHLSHKLFDDGVLIFKASDCHAVTLRSRRSRYSMRLSFPDFPNFALWSFCNKQAPYLCIEPWHGLPCIKNESSVLAEKPFCILLAAGSEKKFGYYATFTE